MTTGRKPKTFSIYGYYVDKASGPASESVAKQVESIFRSDQYFADGISVVSCKQSSSNEFEFRDIDIDESAGVAFGLLSRIREDRPHVRDRQRKTKPLALDEGSNILESNYFCYRFRDRLLLWNFNLRANSAQSFGQMLSRIKGNLEAFAVTPVVIGADLNKGAIIEEIDFRVSAPRRQAYITELNSIDPSNWDPINPFKIMAATGATTMKSVIKTRAQSGLNQRSALQFLSGLRMTSLTRRLKVRSSDVDEPIDLLTNRFRHKTHVQVDLHNNLLPESVWRAFDDAFRSFDQTSQHS